MRTLPPNSSSSSVPQDADAEFSLYLARLALAGEHEAWLRGEDARMATELKDRVARARSTASAEGLIEHLLSVAIPRNREKLLKKQIFIRRFLAGEAHMPKDEDLDSAANMAIARRDARNRP